MPTVRVRGGSLHYEDLGSGDPLVFLPGLGGDVRAFSIVGRHMSDRRRVLVFDPRDAGRSFRADAPYGTKDMAGDFAEAFDALGIGQAHVVGHSLGGLVAQELALGRPDLVRSLVLASTHAGSNAWRKAVIASWVLMRPKVSPGEFAKVTLPWLVAHRFYTQTAQVEGLSRFADRNEWPQAPDAFERQANAAADHEARDRVAGIACPTLVVVGDEDLVNPPRIAGELASLIPGAKLEVMTHVGHMPHVEAGVPFREIVAAFLESLA